MDWRGSMGRTGKSEKWFMHILCIFMFISYMANMAETAKLGKGGIYMVNINRYFYVNTVNLHNDGT